MNDMKKMIFTLLACCAFAVSYAQDGQDISGASDKFAQKYDMLVSKLGYAGVGVETVLDNWEQVDPDNRKLLLAKYSYYLTKSQSSAVVQKPGTRYLGNEPLFALKDSTRAEINYFEETNYDDSLFSIALKNLDKAISLFPKALDIRFMKAAALTAYEKESPDMAFACLSGIIDDYYASKDGWKFGEEDVDDEFFEGAVQEYGFVFYNIASDSSYETFKALSEKMLAVNPNSTVFLSNIGSYYLVAQKDYKKALKYYNKVLKINPDDYTAIKNCVLLSRRQKNLKLEKKYLPMLVRCTPDETERMSAQTRLDLL